MERKIKTLKGNICLLKGKVLPLSLWVDRMDNGGRATQEQLLKLQEGSFVSPLYPAVGTRDNKTKKEH